MFFLIVVFTDLANYRHMENRGDSIGQYGNMKYIIEHTWEIVQAMWNPLSQFYKDGAYEALEGGPDREALEVI